VTDLSLSVLGARGSRSAPGTAFQRYGGHTTAFTVSGGGTTLLLDCGTGLVGATELDSTYWWVFLTHYHSDHLDGLRSFQPLYEEGRKFTFYGHHPDGMSVEEAIGGTFRPPFFPVAIEDTPSTKEYVELGPDPLVVGGIEVSHARLHHPQGVVGYRFSYDGGSIVVATDHEAGNEAADAALRKLAWGADVLVHDSQYTPQDYERHRGWGHSTWEDAVVMAIDAEVSSLVLTSHAPGRTDDEIDDIVSRAQERFTQVSAAREGMVITL
jgi:phosphoribosyl 1,2-cyclic phosphodiesterase